MKVRKWLFGAPVVALALMVMGCTPPTQPAPVVTGMSPSSGPEGGGTMVTITGTDLTGATAVSFGTTPASSFTVDPGGTEISATSPAGTGTVDVTVTTPGGTSATGSATKFTYEPPLPSAPVVTGVSPSWGPKGGGAVVTITGTDLTGATVVSFGTTPASSFTVDPGGTEISATSPAGSGTVDVTVTTPGGTSATGSATKFTYDPVGLAPNTCLDGSDASPDIRYIGPIDESPNIWLYTTADGTCGGHPAAWATAVFVEPTGDAVADEQAAIAACKGFNEAWANVGPADAIFPEAPVGMYLCMASVVMIPTPTISAVTPMTGPEDGATMVVITGSGLEDATAVTFGTASAASFTVDSDTQITAVTPPGEGIVDVTVTSLDGTTTNTRPFVYVSSSDDDPTGIPAGVCQQTGVLGDMMYSGSLSPSHNLFVWSTHDGSCGADSTAALVGWAFSVVYADPNDPEADPLAACLDKDPATTSAYPMSALIPTATAGTYFCWYTPSP